MASVSEGPAPWPTVAREPGQDFKVFTVARHQARSPRTGQVRTFSVIDCPAWVNVIALTPDDQVLLVRQFRHGTQAVTLEIPGGMVDPGEAPQAAAARELREETGHVARRWVSLGAVAPNPAIQTNRCHTFLALDAEPVGGLIQDPGEDLVVTQRPLAELPGLFADGTIDHALVVAAFFHLLRVSRGWRRPPTEPG